MRVPFLAPWLVAMLLAGCGGRTAITPVPAIDFSTVDPSVRPDLEKAWRASRDMPGDLRAARQLAQLLHRLEKHSEAEAAYRRAIEINPEDKNLHYLRGVVLLRLERPDLAADEFQNTLAYPPAAYRYGEYLLKMGRGSEAEALYRQIAERRPELAPAHHGLGRALESQFKVVEAELAYREASRLDPGAGEPRAARIRVLAAMREKDAHSRAVKDAEGLPSEPLKEDDPVLAEVTGPAAR